MTAATNTDYAAVEKAAVTAAAAKMAWEKWEAVEDDHEASMADYKAAVFKAAVKAQAEADKAAALS